MADKRIEDLTQATQITRADFFVLQQAGEARKLAGETLLNFLTLNIVSVTVETLAPGSVATATYNSATKNLAFGIPRGDTGKTGDKGDTGPANTLSIGSVTSGSVASASITGDTPNQELNLVLQKGDKGTDAPTITGITIRQTDYHMIVTMSDGESYDAGYCRGASGSGTGDMLASVYDPQGKRQDIFKFATDEIAKWFADLGSLAFKSSVSKSDLASDVQDSLDKADSAVNVSVATADNGKFLRVVNGEWAAATVPDANGVSF